jgi:glycine cleavage system H protein
VYSPISGEITAVNEALADSPETVNSDPYGDGWLFRLKPADSADLDNLLSATDYASVAAEDE